jgi:hypothetical protein
VEADLPVEAPLDLERAPWYVEKPWLAVTKKSPRAGSRRPPAKLGLPEAVMPVWTAFRLKPWMGTSRAPT